LPAIRYSISSQSYTIDRFKNKISDSINTQRHFDKSKQALRGIALKTSPWIKPIRQQSPEGITMRGFRRGLASALDTAKTHVIGSW